MPSEFLTLIIEKVGWVKLICHNLNSVWNGFPHQFLKIYEAFNISVNIQFDDINKEDSLSLIE
jgi:hypothetical protein